MYPSIISTVQEVIQELNTSAAAATDEAAKEMLETQANKILLLSNHLAGDLAQLDTLIRSSWQVLQRFKEVKSSKLPRN